MPGPFGFANLLSAVPGPPHVPTPDEEQAADMPSPVMGGVDPNQMTFGQRHPRLAGFLRALGPALASLDTQQQVTPYPQGPASVIAGAAKSFEGAKDAIFRSRQADTMKNLLGSRAYQEAQNIAMTDPTKLSAGQLYLLRIGGQMGGVGAPESFVGGGETAQMERAKGGTALTAGQTQEGQLKGREIGVQEEEQKTRTKALQAQIDEMQTKHQEFLQGYGLEKARIGIAAQELSSRNAAAIENAMDNYAAPDPAHRKALRAYLESRIYGTPLDPKDANLVDEIPNVTQITADARAASAEARQSQFIKLAQGLVDRDFRKQGKTPPPELENAIAFLSRPDLPKLLDQGDANAQNALETFDKYFPSAQGGGVMAFLSGVGSRALSALRPEAKQSMGEATDKEVARVKELRDKFNSSGTLTPGEMKELDDIKKRRPDLLKSGT